jgi:succinate-acetate transporter protein
VQRRSAWWYSSVNLFLIAFSYTGVLPGSVIPVFLATGFFYGFVQIMAGLHEYRIGSVFSVPMVALILFDLAEFGAISIVPGAWARVLDALLAWYMSAALVLLEVTKRPILPFGPAVLRVPAAGAA